jgi:hypothetical protein
MWSYHTPQAGIRPVACYFNVLQAPRGACLFMPNQPPAPPNVGGLSGGGGTNVSVLGS